MTSPSAGCCTRPRERSTDDRRNAVRNTVAATERFQPGAMTGQLQQRLSLRQFTLLIVLAIVWIAFQFLTDNIYLTPRNLGLLALQSSIVSLAAISAVMLIVTRNFDLSVGSAVALVGACWPY